MNFYHHSLRVLIMLAMLFAVSTLKARPVSRTHKTDATPLTYLQQMNTVSNVEFDYTDRGNIFNPLYWPRGSNDGYLYGEGIWFATRKELPNSAEAKDGWSLAGLFPESYNTEPHINCLFANSVSRRLFVAAEADTSLYVFQDTDVMFKTLISFAGGVAALAEFPNSNLLIGTTKGLFVGPESGPWSATTITTSVSAISSFGVICAGKIVTNETIYTPNASASSWTPRQELGRIDYLSSSLNNKSILAASNTTLMLSEDTGNTFDTIPHLDTNISGAVLTSGGSIVIVTPIGIFQSFDKGSSWASVNAGLTDLNIRFIRSDDGINFVIATDSGVFTNTVVNGMFGTWNLKNAGVSWYGSVIEAVIDAGGSLHVANSVGEIYTQWRSKTLVPGLELFCDVGFNPNSGTGWYTEGEASQVGLTTTTDGADPNAKYISYDSPRYDPITGDFIPGSSSVVPAPFYSWPLWDTSSSNALGHDFYFGDYVSDVNMRNAASIQSADPQLGIIGKTPKPAIISQEDILNLYTDADSANDPEFVPGTGYPLGIDIQEEIYTWGYGSYRDMVFVRYKVKNSSNDTLYDSWIAPAVAPELGNPVGGAGNDANSYVTDSLVNALADSLMVSQLSEPYRTNPSLLNMAVQWRNFIQPPNGEQYGWFGISFVESPVVDSNGYIIPNDDSTTLHGYGPNSLFQRNQEGLVTCRDWIILDDPSTSDLRYDFVSNGEKDTWNNVYQDQRLLIATGPFNLLPGQSAEATVALTFAHVSDTSYKQNFGALLLLAELEHEVFGEVDSTKSGGLSSYFVNNFQVTPPSSVKSGATINGITMDEPYPNPFSTNCTISYQNSVAGAASAIVTDVLGRTMQNISLGEVSAGEHTLTIGGSNLPAGNYHVLITVGSASSSQMIVHIP